MPSSGRWLLALFAFTALLPLTPPSVLLAQEIAVAELRGEVLEGAAGLAAATVVLHRVGPQVSGPLDSIRTAGDGSFRFYLPNVPDPAGRGEVYFASVRYGGVTYFGSPIDLAAQLDSIYMIRVYDAEEVPPGGASLPVEARYTLIEQQADSWTATDLFHVRNGSERTLVAGADGATWVYPLPQGASDLEVVGGQMSPDAAKLMDGNLRITSAIPPGEREFVVRYRLQDPFVALSYPGTTDEVELLVREPSPQMIVAGLEAVAPVEVEPGVRYRRYIGAQLTDALIVVREAREPPRLPLAWLAVGLALVLTMVALFAVLRPHPAVGVARAGTTRAASELAPFEQRQLLLLELARLDEIHEAGASGAGKGWAERRQALLERVRELSQGDAAP